MRHPALINNSYEVDINNEAEEREKKILAPGASEEVAHTPPIQVISKWYIRLYRRHNQSHRSAPERRLLSVRARTREMPCRRRGARQRRQMPPGVVKLRDLPQIGGNWCQFVSISPRRGWLHSRGLCTQRVGINLIPDASDRLINFHGRRTCSEREKDAHAAAVAAAAAAAVQHFPRESIYPRCIIQTRTRRKINIADFIPRRRTGASEGASRGIECWNANIWEER